MIIKDRNGIKLIIFWVLISIILTGCLETSESEPTKTDNLNQSVAISNNSNTAIANSPNISSADNSSVNPGTTIATPNVQNTQSVDKKNKPSSSASPPAPVTSGGQDFFLVTKVNSILNSDKDLSGSVVAEAKEGVVTLTGKVASKEQKLKVEQLVKEVEGVKTVKNQIRVSPK